MCMLSASGAGAHAQCAAQVAERSLFLWNNEYIVSLVAQQRGAVLPLVFAALERNAASHWNPAVHGLTCNVRKMFQDMDEQLYEECRLRYEAEEVRRLSVAVGGWHAHKGLGETLLCGLRVA